MLSAIAEQSPVHVMDLAKGLDEHPVTVDQMCAHLHENGYIRPATHGSYTLTKSGQQRLGKNID